MSRILNLFEPELITRNLQVNFKRNTLIGVGIGMAMDLYTGNRMYPELRGIAPLVGGVVGATSPVLGRIALLSSPAFIGPYLYSKYKNKL
jgi:hypothetical protein